MLITGVRLVVLTFGIFTVCEGKPTFSCKDNEFPCNDGSCVDKQKWCDTSEQCLDGSDEQYCFTRTLHRPNPNRCDESFFLCRDGRCIPIVGRCDGYASCSDFSDEENCSTTALLNETTVPLHEFTTSAEVKTHRTESPATTLESSTHLEMISEHDMLRGNSSQNANKSLEMDYHPHSYNIKADLNKFQNISDINYALEHMKPHSHHVAEMNASISEGTTAESREKLDPYDNVVIEDMNTFLNVNESSDLSEYVNPHDHVAEMTASISGGTTVESRENSNPNGNVVKEDMNALNVNESSDPLEDINPPEHFEADTSASENTSGIGEALQHSKLNYHYFTADMSASENIRESNYNFQHQESDNHKDADAFLSISESNDALEHIKPHEHPVKVDESISRELNESKQFKEHPKSQDGIGEVDPLTPQNKSQGDDSSNHNHLNVLKGHKEVYFNKIPKWEDRRKTFSEFNPNDFRLQRSNAQKWLVKIRDENYGWGEETARAITALYMSNDDLMIKPSDKLLMSNRLYLKLFAALMRNDTENISLGELALYINALSASCDNPRNFYGQDLVGILRQRTDVAQETELVVPLVYLVLCLNNAASKTDTGKLQKFILETQNIEQVGVKATASLALTCMHRSLKLSSFPQDLPASLFNKVKNKGLSENIYDLALMVQALNEARIDQDLWNRSEMMDRILTSQKSDGSFGDILSTYYVMPLLSGRSLLSLNQHCRTGEDEGLVPVNVLKDTKDDKWKISYFLRFGNPPHLSQMLQLQVKKFTNFFDIMRISESINPAYKFRYVMKGGMPSVYSIGGVVNDPEQGKYWSLHVGSRYQQNATGEVLQPFEGDIRRFVPSEEQYAVFWMKRIF